MDKYQWEIVKFLVPAFTEAEIKVLRGRDHGITLEKIAEEMKISRERVRTLELRALRKLKALGEGKIMWFGSIRTINILCWLLQRHHYTLEELSHWKNRDFFKMREFRKKGPREVKDVLALRRLIKLLAERRKRWRG